jgi:hypothetical protein
MHLEGCINQNNEILSIILECEPRLNSLLLGVNHIIKPVRYLEI